MLEIVIEEEGRESRTVRVSQFPCQIGRGREAGVQLSGWRIARVHAELQRIGRGIKLVDQGTLVGTRVNGERIVEYGPLSEKDEIEVAGYRLRVQGDALRQAGPQPDARLFGDEGAGGREAGGREPRALHGGAGVLRPLQGTSGVPAGVGADTDGAAEETSRQLADAVIRQAARLDKQAQSDVKGGRAGSLPGAAHAIHAADGAHAVDVVHAADTASGAEAANVSDATRAVDGADKAYRDGEAGMMHRADIAAPHDGMDGTMTQVLQGTPEQTTADSVGICRTVGGSRGGNADGSHAAGNGFFSDSDNGNGSGSSNDNGNGNGNRGHDGNSRAGSAQRHAGSTGNPAGHAGAPGTGTGSRQTSEDEAEQARLAGYARAAQEQTKALGWRRLVQRQLLEVIDLRRSNLTQFSADEVKAEVRSAVERIVAELKNLPEDIDREMLVQDSVDEAVGLGPLERLMTDPLVSEIMVNSASDIFVERKGKLQQVPLAFSDDNAIRNVIERIVAPLGRRIDESSPLVDARLPDGSRVNAIIPPVALKGPSITIRRFNRTVMTPATLVQNASASAAMMEFLRISVEQHKSIIVSGGTGSGKTTLLNVLSNLIPQGERLITIEDAAELKLNHPHLVSLESRPPNAEGRGAITIRDLVKNALRMRPDRIIVGECRGAEALDMAQAMNTGHEGSMTTVHANTPRDVLSRLEVLMLMAGLDLPVTALREQIASAVDLIIHQARFSDGSRRITSITEVCGVESGKIQSHEIFRFEQTGIGADGKIIGRFRACDEVPSFYEALRDRGVKVDFSIFEDHDK